MNIDKLIHDLRARINPQYYDQIGTESYERNQCVMALEYLQQENERQRFDILAMNQSLDLLREENERLRKDAERYRWLRDSDYDIDKLFQHIQEHGLTNTGIDSAIDAARGAK